MTAEIWHCGELAQKIKDEVRLKVEAFVNIYREPPTLHIISIGNDTASQSYLKGKEADCKEVGITCIMHKFPANISTATVKCCLKDLPGKIIIQLPVPKQINLPDLLAGIFPRQDVDCLTSISASNIYNNKGIQRPCTPSGIMTLLEYRKIPVAGKNVCVIGRSNIVGKPMAMMLINEGATVTSCNSLTRNLAEHTKAADIVISAVGKRDLVTKDMIKRNAICIDVGITRGADGKLHGDFDPGVDELAFARTPVPGGIGLLTRAMLLKNIVQE